MTGKRSAISVSSTENPEDNSFMHGKLKESLTHGSSLNYKLNKFHVNSYIYPLSC